MHRLAKALGILLLGPVLLPALEAVPARAFGDSHIGLFADLNASYCGGDTTPFSSVSVYIIANLDSDINAVTAVEFSVYNLPANQGYPVGQSTVTWNTTLTLGDLENGISLAFQDPVYGPYALMGRIDFMPFDDNWIDTDYRIMVKEAPSSGNLVIVNENYASSNVWGGRFTFNCSSPSNCECGMGSSQDASWGKIKSLY